MVRLEISWTYFKMHFTFMSIIWAGFLFDEISQSVLIFLFLQKCEIRYETIYEEQCSTVTEQQCTTVNEQQCNTVQVSYRTFFLFLHFQLFLDFYVLCNQEIGQSLSFHHVRLLHFLMFVSCLELISMQNHPTRNNNVPQ